MLHFEHINIAVKDLPLSLKFYQAAFPHWFIRGGGEREWYGKLSRWVHFGDDYQYIAFNDFGEGENRDLTSHQVGLAHFAFVTNNLSALIERLAQAGFNVAQQGEDNPYRYNVYFIDPDGFEVEFVEYKTDLPALRNQYDTSSVKLG